MSEPQPALPVASMVDQDLLRAIALFHSYLNKEHLGILLRSVLDRAIDSSRTNRVSIADLTQSAKTALGTEVEVAIREALGAPKGFRLDLLLAGVEVDVKCSFAVERPGTSWMIPEEALGHIVILITAWDTHEGSFYRLGWWRAPADASGLSAPNKDRKRGLLKKTRDELVQWTVPASGSPALPGYPMPRNLLLTLSEETRSDILAAPAGPERVATAFRLLPGVALTRSELLTLDVPDLEARIAATKTLLASEGIKVQKIAEGTWQAV